MGPPAGRPVQEQHDVQEPDALDGEGVDESHGAETSGGVGRSDGGASGTRAPGSGASRSIVGPGGESAKGEVASEQRSLLEGDGSHTGKQSDISESDSGIYDMDKENEAVGDSNVVGLLPDTDSHADGVNNPSGVGIVDDDLQGAGVAASRRDGEVQDASPEKAGVSRPGGQSDETGSSVVDEPVIGDAEVGAGRRDVDAESDVALESPVDETMPTGSNVEVDERSDVEVDLQGDEHAPARSNVEDIFDRLRSITEKFSVRSVDSVSAQTGEHLSAQTGSVSVSAEDDDSSADSASDAAGSSASGSSGSSSAASSVAGTGARVAAVSDPTSHVVATAGMTTPVAAAQDDATVAAGKVAVKEITRDLRRVLMDDQSELLDAIRRLGRRAVIARAGADNGAYAGVLRKPLQRFVSEIDASIDDLDLKAAAAAITSRLADPVRSRLRDLAEDNGNTDELGTRVRSIYSESRSRRVPIAAEAAFAAAWPELPPPE